MGSQSWTRLSDFTLLFITRHIHNWGSFITWHSLFILSGEINNCLLLFPNSMLDTLRPRGLIIWCHIFLPFHTGHVVLCQGYWWGLPFPLPVAHVLSELFTMTQMSCGALCSIAYTFTELWDPLHGHSNRNISHYALELHFPDDWWHWETFTYLLTICMFFFGSVCIQVLFTFFKQIDFLLFSCMSFLYILGINPLLNILFVNIFFHCVVAFSFC